MESIIQKILVVGGNGFVGKTICITANLRGIYTPPGSAVCKSALARGFQVTSIRFVIYAIHDAYFLISTTIKSHSSSGRPYTTPKGHSPAWTSKVLLLSYLSPVASSLTHRPWQTGDLGKG